MSIKRKRLRFISSVFLALALTACSTVSPLVFEDPSLTRIWPKAPDVARIKLLRTLKGGEDLVDKSTQKNRLYGWLTGDMAEQMPMASPYGVAADGQGRIWIADPGTHAVHALNLNKRTAQLWNFAGETFLSNPSGVCYDPKRQLVYVSDSDLNKIFIYSDEGQFKKRLSVDPPFGRPAGLALGLDGVLHVADVLAGQVRRFDPSGKELVPYGSPTTPNGLFNRPIGVAVDPEGLIYVIDSMNFRIEVLSPDGAHVASIGELGDQPGTLSRPRGVAIDSQGHIYIADAAFDNIQIFNLKGQLMLVFGSGGPEGLSMPASLYIDSHDRIYVADSSNHQIQIYQFLGVRQ